MEHVVVSSAKLTALKAKGFGKFSVNPASWGLFMRFWAGCAITHEAKEKPLEHCVIPTVYVVAEWWCLQTDFSATLYEGANHSPPIFHDFFLR